MVGFHSHYEAPAPDPTLPHRKFWGTPEAPAVISYERVPADTTRSHNVTARRAMSAFELSSAVPGEGCQSSLFGWKREDVTAAQTIASRPSRQRVRLIDQDLRDWRRNGTRTTGGADVASRPKSTVVW
jgi:hypothetical protein